MKVLKHMIELKLINYERKKYEIKGIFSFTPLLKIIIALFLYYEIKN